MRLLRFRIYDYKSIADSEYCWLASDMTVFAGKNESGKTAILQALYDFDISRTISDDAIPLADPLKKPRLELSFEIDPEQLISICQAVGIGDYSGNLLSSIPKEGLTLYKAFPDQYSLGKDILKTLFEIRDLANKPHLDSVRAAVRTINGDKIFPDISDPKFEEDPSKTASNIAAFVANVGQKAPEVEENRRTVIVEQIALINSETGKLIINSHRKFLETLKPLLPHFILFNDFSDLLPYEITFAEAIQNPIVLDFAKLANLDLNALEAEANTTRRRNELARASATISDDFAGYWNQDQVKLVAEPDGDILRIGIQDADRTELFEVQRRSKGLQWFLSFYLRMHARSGATNIVLIDEPGLYLHAKAQKDVLRVLEKRAEHEQIVYSTHSPYLIEASYLNRIRLVVKDGQYTKIRNKVQSDADQETMTPIITAIGIDIRDSITSFVDYNILVEGISDYYYMQALLEQYLPSTQYSVRVIPVVGASNIKLMASLLLGWGFSFVAVLDTDKAGRDCAKELAKLDRSDNTIIKISDRPGIAIEDLFSVTDFREHVLGNSVATVSDLQNSKLAKENDHVLLAKTFFEIYTQSPMLLSDETNSAFAALFERIKRGFDLEQA